MAVTCAGKGRAFARASRGRRRASFGTSGAPSRSCRVRSRGRRRAFMFVCSLNDLEELKTIRLTVLCPLCEWFFTFYQITNLAALTERQSRTSRSMIVQFVSRPFVKAAVPGSRPVPEHHPGSDQPGSTERSTWSACLPKEPHAQRSWPPSAVTASTAGGIGDQKCG